MNPRSSERLSELHLLTIIKTKTEFSYTPFYFRASKSKKMPKTRTLKRKSKPFYPAAKKHLACTLIDSQCTTLPPSCLLLRQCAPVAGNCVSSRYAGNNTFLLFFPFTFRNILRPAGLQLRPAVIKFLLYNGEDYPRSTFTLGVNNPPCCLLRH